MYLFCGLKIVPRVWGAAFAALTNVMAPHPWHQLVDQLCVEFEREVNQMSKDFPIKPKRVARMSCWKLGSMVRINGLFHLLTNGG